MIITFCGSMGFCITQLMYKLNSKHYTRGMKTRGKGGEEERKLWEILYTCKF